MVPVRTSGETMCEACAILQGDTKMQTQGVLWIQIKCNDLHTGSRQCAGNVRRQSSFPDAAFRRCETDKRHHRILSEYRGNLMSLPRMVDMCRTIASKPIEDALQPGGCCGAFR